LSGTTPGSSYEDGQFVWYDRQDLHGFTSGVQALEPMVWDRLGPLDPQPAGREKVRKPKRARLKGDDLAKRKTVTIKLPENCDGALWEELLAEAEDSRAGAA
jgi:hypothetical protein